MKQLAEVGIVTILTIVLVTGCYYIAAGGWRTVLRESQQAFENFEQGYQRGAQREARRAELAKLMDALRLTPEQCQRLAPAARMMLAAGLERDPEIVKLNVDILRECGNGY